MNESLNLSEPAPTSDLSAIRGHQVEPLLQFFAYAHLPAALQGVSKGFGDLAQTIVATLPRNPERTVALRKLLEAKDCAVRAVIYKG